MVKINRPLVGAFATLLFLMSCWGGWFSLSEYMAFFKLSHVITFSWKVGVLVFAVPLLLYFSYLAFYTAIKNKMAKMNNKLANLLAIIAICGTVVSFLSSIYISFSLSNSGYVVCQKISWMDPNKYVKDIALCDEG
ncbi:DUF1240 domain-containing protein [Pectobacterium cacticida]|uniref:DUF1240 domain-containing protein n=1 Tax=Pectobacterium cacticida TaxID=69221 RepID=UPI002FF321AD